MPRGTTDHGQQVPERRFAAGVAQGSVGVAGVVVVVAGAVVVVVAGVVAVVTCVFFVVWYRGGGMMLWLVWLSRGGCWCCGIGVL